MQGRRIVPLGSGITCFHTMNRFDRATLDRIQQELEKALWSLRQFLDQVDAEHTAEDEVQTCLEHTERGTNGAKRD